MSEQIEQALERKYDAGFYSEIESETFESGLDESVIRRISAMKNEPEWMLEWRFVVREFSHTRLNWSSIRPSKLVRYY